MPFTSLEIAKSFPRYNGYNPLVPVYQITDGSRPVIHRFYDTSPISPSGRYIALNEFPFEDHLPTASDSGSVFVIDLSNGKEVFRDNTSAWDTQLGAHAQWGETDNELYFNFRGDDGLPCARRVNLETGAGETLKSPVYMISPDGTTNAAPSVEKLCLVQPGYGLIMPDVEAFRHTGAPADDGLFVSDTRTGERRLLLSLREIWDSFPEAFAGLDPQQGGLYGFHVKWSPDGNRLMFIVRWLPKDAIARRTKNFLITCDKNGQQLHMPVDSDRWQGGHHPNWCPDSETIVMNLRFTSMPRKVVKMALLAEKALRRIKLKMPIQPNPMKFATFRFDGTQLRPVIGRELGSGHPTFSPDSRFLLSDAYPYEDVTQQDGTVPLRIINLSDGSMKCAVRIHCKPAYNGPNAEFRVDPHPAWHNRSGMVAFNACPNGMRAVYIADFSGLLAA